ncbi:hypothetical protein EWM64_g5633 [Hericium alpestre]|uniref:Major facilitator superfamily (MFS) profile domain-containing protein n=1 Tax=Hericium alpestre TaxID=135208 RepID=A0A4Y9ZUA0_9AGAM|nr:hypothetical protein EWM64_g5633 [Hericium alpestre]
MLPDKLWPIFTTANLCSLAGSFHVDYSEVSNIPTLLQGGYATGLLLLTPLGDLVPRRPLLLSLSFIAAGLTIGLSITKSLVAFEVLSFLVGVFSVSGQILLPFAADLAPPERRATAISIVISGLLLGVLIARVFSGIIAEFATWRVVYYLAIGMQYLVLFLLWVMLPDYPAKNVGLSYFDILRSMAKLAFTEPELIQASLITVASSACFTTFWVTLTFLLGGPLYNFSTLAIGLFGLIGIGGVCMAPIVGRVIDRVIPWYATLFSTLMLLATLAIYTGAAGENVAAVVIVTIGIDVFRQMQQTSLTAAVLAIDESARSRINAVIILAFFIGTVMGTPVGSRVFLEHGWRAAGGLMLAWVGWQLAMLFLRGPHVGRYTWVGWSGGMEWRKDVVKARKERWHQQDENGTTEDAEEVNVEQDGKLDERKSEDVTKAKDPSSVV